MQINREEIEQDIDTLIELLRRAKDLNDYKYIKSNIELLLDLYFNLFHEKYNCVVPKSTLMEYVISLGDKSIDQIYCEEYLEDKERHNEVANTILQVLSKYQLPGRIVQEIIKPKEFIEIVNSFFKSTGGEIGKEYESLIKSNHINFTREGYKDSETDHVFMLNKSYVSINAKSTVEGLIDFAHEVGHAYAKSKIQDSEAAYNDCLSYYEFYSCFMERMMIRYLIDNGIVLNDAIKSNQKYFKELGLFAKDLLAYKGLEKGVTGIEDDRLSSAMIYMYGKYLGAIKSLDYTEDREETIERIDDYLKSQGIASKEESLDILGIDYDELISGKKLERTLKKNNM